MTRCARVVAWALLMFVSWSWASTRPTEVPPIHDGLDGPELPEVLDRRPEPVLIGIPEAASAERYMDVVMLAELGVGEDPNAPAAVAWTVVNRARASGRSLLAEVTARGQYGTRKGGRWVRSWPPRPGWARAHAELILSAWGPAAEVLDGRRPDPTGGATHFHRLGTWVPAYAPPPAKWRVLGVHAFYKPLRRAALARRGALRGR